MSRRRRSRSACRCSLILRAAHCWPILEGPVTGTASRKVQATARLLRIASNWRR